MSKLQTAASPRPALPRALERAGVWLVLFLCVFIPARNLLEECVGTVVKLIPDLLIVALFCWYVLAVRARLSFLPQDFFFLAFLGVAFVNTVFLQDVGLMPFVFQVRSIGIYYVLYFVLRNVSFTRRDYVHVLRLLQGVTLVLAVFGVVEKIFSKTVLFPASWAEGILYASNFTRIYSLFNNPNTYGLFLVLVFFFSVFFRMRCDIRTSPVFTGVLFGCLLLSMSRSSILALVLGVVLTLVWLLVREGKKLDWRRILTSALVIVAVGFVLYRASIEGAGAYLRSATERDPTLGDSLAAHAVDIEAEDRLNQTLTEEELELSAVSGRVFSLKRGLEIFPSYPVFGTGFGTFGSAASMNFDTALEEKYELPKNFYSDNEYIVILVETGLVGTLLFAGFLLSCLWGARRDFGKFCVCILIGWFGLFYNVFEVQIGAMLFWVFLSFADQPYPKKPALSGELSVGEIRAIQMDILKTFADFCEERGLRYYLYGGTLLGALRHGGYIPWDDDIDICMPRADYEKFLALCEEAPIGEHYRLLSHHNNPRYPYPFAKVHDVRTLCRVQGIDESVSLGVWVDVFPMDGLPAGRDLQEKHVASLQKKIRLLNRASRSFYFTKSWSRLLKNLALRAAFFAVPVSALVRALDRAAQKYDYEISPFIGVIAFCRGMNNVIEKAGFEEARRLAFEGVEFAVPATTEAYLARLYGEDYMQLPPEGKRGTHSYHAYRKGD